MCLSVFLCIYRFKTILQEATTTITRENAKKMSPPPNVFLFLLKLNNRGGGEVTSKVPLVASRDKAASLDI